MGQACRKNKHQAQPMAKPSDSLDSLKPITSTEDIRTVYRFSSKLLGNGNFGSVRLATLVKNPDFRFAVKTIQK